VDHRVLARATELTGEFEIRRGLPSQPDACAFVDLMNSAYTRKLSPEYYFWQYFTHPYPAVCLLAFYKGSPAATYGLLTRPVSGAAVQRISLEVDLVVAAAFRGSPLWMRLEAEMESVAAQSGGPLIWAFPNEASYHPRIYWLGWHGLGKIATLAASTSIAPHLSSHSLEFAPVTCFGSETDDVFERFVADHPQLVIAGRDQTYLNWRFINNPRYRYECFLAKRGSRPVGYLVLKQFRSPESSLASGDLVDILWNGEAETLIPEMLDFACLRFRSAGIETLNLWAETRTAFDQIVRSAGFSESCQQRFWCYTQPSVCQWPELVRSRCYLTMADSEVY